MKKTILSLALVGSLIIATSACNSTRNASETRDSTGMDSTTSAIDTASTTMPPDTTRTTMPPDTTRTMPPM